MVRVVGEHAAQPRLEVGPLALLRHLLPQGGQDRAVVAQGDDDVRALPELSPPAGGRRVVGVGTELVPDPDPVVGVEVDLRPEPAPRPLDRSGVPAPRVPHEVVHRAAMVDLVSRVPHALREELRAQCRGRVLQARRTGLHQADVQEHRPLGQLQRFGRGRAGGHPISSGTRRRVPSTPGGVWPAGYRPPLGACCERRRGATRATSARVRPGRSGPSSRRPPSGGSRCRPDARRG